MGLGMGVGADTDWLAYCLPLTARLLAAYFSLVVAVQHPLCRAAVNAYSIELQVAVLPHVKPHKILKARVLPWIGSEWAEVRWTWMGWDEKG